MRAKVHSARSAASLLSAVLLLCMGLVACAPSAPGEAEQAGAYTDVAILSTTDMHGKCWETDVVTGASTPHNMLRVSTAVQQVREEYGPENVLLIDNGDIFQGTQTSEYRILGTGSQDDPIPAMALCLKEIGYTAFVLGNHEFDYPWIALQTTYNWLEDNGTAVLAANVCFDGEVEGTTNGQEAFTPYMVQPITVNGHEHTIGILGLENTDIPFWELPVTYYGLSFVHPGNDRFSIAEEAARYIPQMKGEGCEFIIVSYHGALGDAEGELVYGVNTVNQGLRLISESEDIDLLITGHDHSTAYSNERYPDATGREVTVVNGGGQELTQTVFRFSEDEDGALTWEQLDSTNLSLDSYAVDESLQALIAPYAEAAEEAAEQPLGTATGSWDGLTDHLKEQTDTADLVHVAVIEMSSLHLAEEEDAAEAAEDAGCDHLDVDLSVQSSVAAGYAASAGSLSTKDCYRLLRYANTAVVLPMTGAQIKAMMEENAAEHLAVRVLDGETYVYTRGDLYTNLLFGGLDFTYDMARPAGERVRIEGFANGRAFDEGAVYLVATSNYLLGNDGCGLRDFSADDCLWLQADEGTNEVVQDLLAEYIMLMQETRGGVSPEAFTWHWGIDYTAAVGSTLAEGEFAARYVAKPEDGHTYVIYHEAEECAVGSAENGDGLAEVAWEPQGDLLPAPMPKGTLVVTAHAGADGTWQFSDASGDLLVSSAGGGLRVAAMPEDQALAQWRLEQVPGGWQLHNAGTANEQALEHYGSRFMTYSSPGSDYYTVNFYELV